MVKIGLGVEARGAVGVEIRYNEALEWADRALKAALAAQLDDSRARMSKTRLGSLLALAARMAEVSGNSGCVVPVAA